MEPSGQPATISADQPGGRGDERERDLGVFVIGMHRAGTSAVARVVNLLGVPTGSEEALKGPSPGNPTGYWEISELSRFNEGLLGKFGGTWQAPPLLSDAWTRDGRLDPVREPAREIFYRHHDTPQWVWKDPRNCILLPFWLAALDVRPVVVLVTRHPLEIAESLASRDGFSTRFSLALWERYVRQALLAAHGMAVLVARYSQVLRAPEAWRALAGEFLSSQGIDCSGAASEADTARFLDPGLRHAEFSAEDVAADHRFSDAQRQLFEAVERLAPTYERLEPPPLPEETPWTEPLLAERRFTEDAQLAERERRQAADRARRKALHAMRGPIERIERGLMSEGGRGAQAQMPIKRMRRDVQRAGELLAEALAAEETRKADRERSSRQIDGEGPSQAGPADGGRDSGAASASSPGEDQRSPAALATPAKRLRRSPFFKAYERVRDHVLEMRKEAEGEPAAAPGAYAAQRLARIEYMLDASPREVAELRKHAGRVTDPGSNDRQADDREAGREVRRRLKLIAEAGPSALLVPELELLGGSGAEAQGVLYSAESLRYSESLFAMERGNILPSREAGDRWTVWEIGAGWGGFAYQFKTLYPDVTYVISDFPLRFLFSATYLMSAFPEASVAFHRRDAELDWAEHDFVFVANAALEAVSPEAIDLTIGISSFEELTTAQVDAYAAHAHRSGSPYLYSCGRDRAPGNAELDSAHEVIGRYFWPHEVEMPSPKGSTEDQVGPEADEGADRFRHVIGWRRLKV